VTGFGVSFDGRNPVPALLEQARAAEAAGAVTCWVSDHLFLREPFVMAAAVLSATTRARAALLAVSPHVVHPVQIAMAAATLDELAPGRVVLCLGTGVPGDLADAGVDPKRRLRALREALELTRMLLAGETVNYDGEIFRVHGRRLHTGPRAVPIVLAASGPRTLELAGAAADGVLLSTASSVEFVGWALDHVERGAKGRTLTRAGLVYVSPADRDADALGRFRRQLAITLRSGHHARNVSLAGGALDHEGLRRAVLREDWPGAEAFITDDIVRRHSASGTVAEVRERLAAYAGAGLDEIVLAGMYDAAETSRALAVAAPLAGASGPRAGG
jgi:5,10-methylenetetrahydromethanopterin reductase